MHEIIVTIWNNKYLGKKQLDIQMDHFFFIRLNGSSQRYKVQINDPIKWKF